MRFKLLNWIIIIVSILAVAWFLFQIQLWQDGWNTFFSYAGDWKMWVILAILATGITGIIKWILVTEVKLLK